MKTKLNKILLIALTLFLCTASSCIKEQPCPVYEDRHYHISEEEMAYVPYTGYDTLTFLRFQGNHVDTIIFAGQGIQEYIEHDSYGYGEHHCDGRILKHSIFTDYVSNDSLEKYKYKLKVIPTKIFSSYFIEVEGYNLKVALSDLNNTTAPYFIPELVVDSLRFENVVYRINRPHNHNHSIYYNKINGIIRIELRDSSIIYQLIP